MEKMRREAWEKYAADNQQEFKLLSEDKAPDLSMSVGDTPIKYADEHNVTMGNGEYAKFLKAVEIEKMPKPISLTSVRLKARNTRQN